MNAGFDRNKNNNRMVLKMKNYDSREQIAYDEAAITASEIMYQNNVYTKNRIIDSVRFGDYENLQCIVFRCEKESHNVEIYHNGEEIKYVGTGYSMY
jgi:hypothetical protein